MKQIKLIEVDESPKKKKKSNSEPDWIHSGHPKPEGATHYAFLFFSFDIDVHPSDAQCKLCGSRLKYSTKKDYGY